MPDLLEAVTTAAASNKQTEIDLVHAVQTAKEGGHSWAEIGATLGISRQAAHERFAKRISHIQGP